MTSDLRSGFGVAAPITSPRDGIGRAIVEAQSPAASLSCTT
jgi:hypothetical protein